MPEDILYKSIDLLLTSPFEEVEFQFFGGEPLLRFDLIEKAITYGEKKSKTKRKKIKFLLTTNGLLLKEDRLEYLARHNTAVLFSLDGSKNIQTKNRPLLAKNDSGYFEQIIRNLEILIAKPIEYFVNMVFLPEDLEDLKDNINFLISIGVRNIRLSYAIGADFKKKDLFFYQDRLRKIIKLTESKKVNFLNLYDDNEPIFASPQINIDSLGNIYIGCALVLEKLFPYLNELFYIGNLRDIKDISSLRRNNLEQMRVITKYKHKLPLCILNIINFGMVISKFLKEAVSFKKAESG